MQPTNNIMATNSLGTSALIQYNIVYYILYNITFNYF